MPKGKLSKIYQLSFFNPISIFAISLVIYFLTLAPTYLPPDGAEFALCIQTIGICHPTGFFLYILLGKLFTFLFPFGSLIIKVNLLSAIYASATAVFTYLSLLKMDVSKRISFLVVLVYAFSASMWNYSISADIFTFGTLLLSITLYAVITNRFYLSFLFFGLLTSHFPNSVILLPLLILYWKKSDEEKSIKSLVLSSSVFFLALLLFNVLLYLRMQQQPLVDWGHVASLGDFYNYFTRKEFGGIFLIQTKQSMFSISNFFLQLWAYVETMFVEFGFILPIIAVYSIIRAKLYKNTLVLYLIYSFILLAGFNLFSLSSLNPGVSTNFQYDKYYLSSFTILILLLGIGLGKMKGATARKRVLPGLLVIIIMIQLLVNFAPHNYRNDYFSQSMVNDSLSELPDNAIAITITNQNFFDAWYEQVILNKYKNVTLLYFPNNINTDYEKYHPELFSNSGTTQQAVSNETTDPTSQAIVNLIAQNPNRPIFIWQGLYENGIFASNNVLSNMLIPYGLWWKVGNPQTNTYANSKYSKQLLSTINYTDINTNELNSVQRNEELQTYPEALQSTSFAYANLGKFDEAISLLNVANSVDNSTYIQREISAINEINQLGPQTQAFIKQQDENSLLELATDYYTVKDFPACITIFKDILTFDTQDPQLFSNIGAMYAMENDKNDALTYFDKALQLDPNLSGAVEGKNQLESEE